jgi:predicted nucleic acid-binding Zn ribbon protein
MTMAFYDYRCDVNGETIEVQHPVTEKLHTWQELCECAGRDLGDTPGDTPIKRLLNGGAIAKGASQTAFTPAMNRQDAGHACSAGCRH